MSTPEDLLKWLRGQPVEGMPDNTREEDDGEVSVTSEEIAIHVGVNLDKMKAAAAKHDRRYTVSIDGTDAMLFFGKFKGWSISNLANNEKGYLRWMLEQEFPSPLQDVIKYQLGILPTFAMKELHGEEAFARERVEETPAKLFDAAHITVWPKHVIDADPKCPTCGGGTDVVCALCPTPTSPIERWVFTCTRCATIFKFKEGKSQKYYGEK